MIAPRVVRALTLVAGLAAAPSRRADASAGRPQQVSRPAA